MGAEDRWRKAARTVGNQQDPRSVGDTASQQEAPDVPVGRIRDEVWKMQVTRKTAVVGTDCALSSHGGGSGLTVKGYKQAKGFCMVFKQRVI